jgi:hypothetical protein
MPFLSRGGTADLMVRSHTSQIPRALQPVKLHFLNLIKVSSNLVTKWLQWEQYWFTGYYTLLINSIEYKKMTIVIWSN